MNPAIVGGLIAASAAITLFNLTRLLQADMPKRMRRLHVGSSHGLTYPSPEEYTKQDKKYRINYMKRMAEYFVTFLSPATAGALVSVVTITLDFEKSIFTLALSLFLTIVSVIYQKIRFRS